MTQKDAINIWMDGAVDAFDTCDKLFENKKYVHALFFLNLAIEKIIKALYISKIDNSPPFIHNLKLLVEKSKTKYSEEEGKQLDEISEYNVSARYDDYKYKIYMRATKEYTIQWIKIGKKLYEKYKKDCK